MQYPLVAGFCIAGGLISSLGQSSQPTSANIITAQPSEAPRFPRYLVYRHFLSWIDTLDKQAGAAGAPDPYKFAEPFAKSAALSDDELDFLRREAKSMTADLDAHSKRASAAIAIFRARAQAAVAAGQPPPAIPQHIRDLQRERTALLVQRFVHLQAGLKPNTRSSLDGYLDREFVPHLSMKHLGVPSFSVPGQHPYFGAAEPQ